jgi:tetratricopeptide (TPR) repeat protein
MGKIIRFQGPASKFGFKRVRKRTAAEDPDQLQLFPRPTAQLLDLSAELGRFEQALLFDERGDSRAAELYRKAIEGGDCIADAHCNLGIIESQKGNTARAFDCFTNSLKHNPRHFEAHYNLGNLYFDLNDFRLAQVHYEMAVEVDPSFANVYFNLALAQAINRDDDAALRTLAKYQELVPEEEGRKADELLRDLKKSIAAAGNCAFGTALLPGSR